MFMAEKPLLALFVDAPHYKKILLMSLQNKFTKYIRINFKTNMPPKTNGYISSFKIEQPDNSFATHFLHLTASCWLAGIP